MAIRHTETKAFEDITREDFANYERVRRGGRWNMWDKRAMAATGLEDDTYYAIMNYYGKLRDKFPGVRKEG